MHTESPFSPADAICSNSPQRRPASAAFGGVNLAAGAKGGASAGHSRGGCAPRSRTSACRSPGARRERRPPSSGAGCSTSTSPGSTPSCRPRNSSTLVEEIAAGKWDFVAIQAVDIDTITAPVVRMIEAGIPVIDMDTLIAPLDQIDVLTFLAPDNEFMGAAVTQALVDAIGGQGTIIMTQGALGHTGAQGRAQGISIGHRQVPWRPGPGDRFGGLGRREDGAALGGLPQDIPEDRRRLLPQRRHGACRGQRSLRRTGVPGS